MSKKVPVPKFCPVCGGDSIHPVARHPLGSTNADVSAISGILGFRCGKGHMFVASEFESAKVKPGKEEVSISEQPAKLIERAERTRSVSRELKEAFAAKRKARTKEPGLNY